MAGLCANAALWNESNCGIVMFTLLLINQLKERFSDK